jgi:purine-nucleoside phosphorylase
MYEKIQETVDHLIKKGFKNPNIGIVMGTGLGNLSKIPHTEIPNFPVSTVAGHSGNLIYGTIGEKKVVALQGRFHYYEGWTMEQATFPIRVMKFLGIDKVIISNAAGGVNPYFKIGDIMLITDHINMVPDHPLRGKNEPRFGPRFVDMHEPYNLDMIESMIKVAQKIDLKLKKGVYLALQGPTFETPAEYKMVHILGADAVGMSTVPEVIVAKHMNMDCLGISVITDLGIEGHVEAVSHEAVQLAAKSVEKDVCSLVENFIISC